MDYIVKIVSRNLANLSNFVEFRDSQNFTYFKTTGVGATCGEPCG